MALFLGVHEERAAYGLAWLCLLSPLRGGLGHMTFPSLPLSFLL